MRTTKKAARSSSARPSTLLSAEERAVMKETVEERRRARSGEVDGESDVLAPQRDSEIFGRRFVYES